MKRILAVDDEVGILRILERTFAGPDYEIRTVNKPWLTLEVLQTFTPDLILLDVMMPQLSGFDLCDKIKEDPRLANIKIMFLSAKSDSSAVDRGYTAGAWDYVRKPFNESELRRKVDILINTQSQESVNAVITTMLLTLTDNIKAPLLGVSQIYNALIPDERVKGPLRIATAAVNEMLVLLRGLSLWAEVKSGSRQIQTVPFRLTDLTLQSNLSRSNRDPISNITGNKLMIGDPVLIQSVLTASADWISVSSGEVYLTETHYVFSLVGTKNRTYPATAGVFDRPINKTAVDLLFHVMRDILHTMGGSIQYADLNLNIRLPILKEPDTV
jgi:DNA-binding response OmpR family regulator